MSLRKNKNFKNGSWGLTCIYLILFSSLLQSERWVFFQACASGAPAFPASWTEEPVLSLGVVTGVLPVDL